MVYSLFKKVFQVCQLTPNVEQVGSRRVCYDLCNKVSCHFETIQIQVDIAKKICRKQTS